MENDMSQGTKSCVQLRVIQKPQKPEKTRKAGAARTTRLRDNVNHLENVKPEDKQYHEIPHERRNIY